MGAFKLAITIFWIVILVTAIINIIYYQKATNGTCSGIGVGFATFMMWLNIVIVVIVAGMFIWTLYKLFRKKPQQQKAGEMSASDDKNTPPPPVSKTYSSNVSGSWMRSPEDERYRENEANYVKMNKMSN